MSVEVDGQERGLPAPDMNTRSACLPGLLDCETGQHNPLQWGLFADPLIANGPRLRSFRDSPYARWPLPWPHVRHKLDAPVPPVRDERLFRDGQRRDASQALYDGEPLAHDARQHGGDAGQPL